MTLQFVYIAFWEYTRETGDEITMKTEVKIEPLTGSKKRRKSPLGFLFVDSVLSRFCESSFREGGPCILRKTLGIS